MALAGCESMPRTTHFYTPIMLASAPPDTELISRYVQVFAIVASLLGAFLLAVLLLMFLRRRRAMEATRRTIDTSAIPDAWNEAGRRAEPFDAPARGSKP